MKIYINGTFYSKGEAKISIFDHAVFYGDGVFEGIRAYYGKVFRLNEHIKRLYESAKSILLAIPVSQEQMRNDVVKTIKMNGLKDAYIRLIVTRGEGPLGLNPFECKDPQIIIIADRIDLWPGEVYDKGLTVITVPTLRNLPEAVNPRIKSLNYLNNILAKIEAINAGVSEAIMLNSFGLVSEGTGENVFAVKENTLLTPSISMGVLEGITRNAVIQLARTNGYEVKQIVMTRHDLFNADECFLSGTAAEIAPVVKVDGRIIGDGKPGKVTKRLMTLYTELTNREGTPVQ